MRLDPSQAPKFRCIRDRICHWSAMRDNARKTGDKDLEREARRELAAANAEDAATADLDTTDDLIDPSETPDSQWSRG